MRFLAAFLVTLLVSTGLPHASYAQQQPTVFLIGDSTVKTGRGEGGGGMWGWGAFLHEHFDPDRINVENHALGGRSSRTFHTEGLWADVLEQVEPGDYVIMQFGHNDSIEPDNERRPRGTLRGTGKETFDIIHPATGEPETVYTYGEYMRRYVEDAREHGATPVVASLIPRNMWTQEGTVIRDSLGYALWAEQVAQETDAAFIPLNELVAQRYDAEGPGPVRDKYFVQDHTHTSEAGARLNAEVVAEGLRAIEDLDLKDYLK